MSGKAAVTVALQPGGDAVTTASEKSGPFVLKKIMALPPPNILEEGDDGKTKNALWFVTPAGSVATFVDLYFSEKRIWNERASRRRLKVTFGP